MSDFEMTREEADRYVDMQAELWAERQQVLAYQGPHAEGCPDACARTDAWRVCDGYCIAIKATTPDEEMPF